MIASSANTCNRNMSVTPLNDSHRAHTLAQQPPKISETMSAMLAHIGSAVWATAATRPGVSLDLWAPIVEAFSSGDGGKVRATLPWEGWEEAGEFRV